MVNVEWVWILIVISILLNLICMLAIVVLFQRKPFEKAGKVEDTAEIHQSIEWFVNKVEKENEALFQKLVNYIKVKESKLDERIQTVEDKIEREIVETTILENPLVEQTDRKQSTTTIHSEISYDEEKISQLYKQGFTPKQIAKVLQMDNGEVELIINLFKKKQGYQK